jgi:hypothetical protein
LWYGNALQRVSRSGTAVVRKKWEEALMLSPWMPRAVAMEALRTALMSSKWGWYGPDVQMTFRDDGTVSHRGMHGRWTLASPRLVVLSISDGDTMYLHFNAELTHYTSLGRGFGGDRLDSGE